jgi:hypothetical protein
VSGVCSPPLCCRPEGLLLDRRETAANIAGRRLRPADVEAERDGFGLDATHDAEELCRRLGRRRARGQKMLGPHNLRDLAEHGRAACIDEAIRDPPERWIGGETRGVVRAAALDAQDQR